MIQQSLSKFEKLLKTDFIFDDRVNQIIYKKNSEVSIPRESLSLQGKSRENNKSSVSLNFIPRNRLMRNDIKTVFKHA